LSDGLVSWWQCDGNADDSVGPNDGVLQNGVTFVAAPTGQALEFNGTTADVLIQTSTTLNLTDGYTIAFWINVPTWPSQVTYIMEKLVAGAEDKAVMINTDGTIDFYLYNVMDLVPLESATALTLNTWHHFAATYDGADANIYIDGLFDASKIAAGDVANSTGALAFAHNATRAMYGSDTFFAGDLADIRWYSRALSAAEVAEIASGCN